MLRRGLSAHSLRLWRNEWFNLVTKLNPTSKGTGHHAASLQKESVLIAFVGDVPMTCAWTAWMALEGDAVIGDTGAVSVAAAFDGPLVRWLWCRMALYKHVRGSDGFAEACRGVLSCFGSGCSDDSCGG